MEIIYEKLSEQLELMIRSGKLRGKLPGVRKLAAEFGTNHITVRKAIELLEEKGRLEVIPSKGTFTRDNLPQKRNHHIIGIVGNYFRP